MTGPNAERRPDPALHGIYLPTAAPAEPPAVVAEPVAEPSGTAPNPAALAYPPAAQLVQAIPTGRGLVDGVATVTAVADAEASAQTLAVGALAAAAGSPQGPRNGTVYDSRETEQPGGAIRRAPDGRQPRLRVGWHTASASALSLLGVSSPGAGLIVGADHEQRPVPVRFFRPEPTRITLVGGLWAAHLLAFRALALGARILVTTVEPAAWDGFGERAVSRGDRVQIVQGGPIGDVTASPRQPLLVIHDLGNHGPATGPAVGPWQTQLTVLRRLDERGVAAVQRNDLLILQRLDPAEAAVAESALRLTTHSARLLQMMEDEMLALIGGGANRYLWALPTSTERQLFGVALR